MDRPNILYVFTDQQVASAMSCSDNPYLHTPAMDSLAETGVRFSEAYCTFPLCTPCRATMWTGMMPHQVGVPANNYPIDEAYRARELGRVLRDAGYDCGYAGKWHIPAYTMPDPDEHGFRAVSPFGDDKIVENCAAFLSEQREKPFFLVASIDNPHNICEWHREEPLPWGPIEERPLADCPPLPANCSHSPEEPYLVLTHQHNSVRACAVDFFTPDDWRRYRSAYYRLVEKADRLVAGLLQALKDNGLYENTVVLFSSDHGDGEGSHQVNNKTVLYEESVRVPFLVSWPGQTQAGGTCTQLTSMLDLYPTICDFAGVKPPDDILGYSLRELCQGKDVELPRDFVPIETKLSGTGGSPIPCLGRAIRSKRHKYICYTFGKHREQLFDLQDDPGEMSNLAKCSHHRQTLLAHRRMMRDWLERTNDAFVSRLPAE